jgi:hypothetical protein
MSDSRNPTELLRSIDQRLKLVQIAAGVFLLIIALQCLLVTLYLAGVISFASLLWTGGR